MNKYLSLVALTLISMSTGYASVDFRSAYEDIRSHHKDEVKKDCIFGIRRLQSDLELVAGVVRKDIIAVKKALSDGANVNLKGAYGDCNILDLATMVGFTAGMKELLEQGADVDHKRRDTWRRTMHIAHERQDQNQIALLRSYGAKGVAVSKVKSVCFYGQNVNGLRDVIARSYCDKPDGDCTNSGEHYRRYYEAIRIIFEKQLTELGL